MYYVLKAMEECKIALGMDTEDIPPLKGQGGCS